MRGRPEWKRNLKGDQPYKRTCGEPDGKAQGNSTDPDGAITRTGPEGLRQCCDAQVAVDGRHRLIVATEPTPNTNDRGAPVGPPDKVGGRFDAQLGGGCLPTPDTATGGTCRSPRRGVSAGT